MELPYHPAPGATNRGQLPPGFLVIPQGEAERRAFGVYRSRGISELIPAGFTLPENPVVDYLSGQRKPLGTSGCGCGCGGTLNGMGIGDWNSALASAESGNFSAALQDSVFGIPVWGWAVGAAFLLFSDFGKGSAAIRGRRAARAAARAY